jgi:hypothetical protein
MRVFNLARSCTGRNAVLIQQRHNGFGSSRNQAGQPFMLWSSNAERYGYIKDAKDVTPYDPHEVMDHHDERPHRINLWDFDPSTFPEGGCPITDHIAGVASRPYAINPSVASFENGQNPNWFTWLKAYIHFSNRSHQHKLGIAADDNWDVMKAVPNEATRNMRDAHRQEQMWRSVKAERVKTGHNILPPEEWSVLSGDHNYQRRMIRYVTAKHAEINFLNEIIHGDFISMSKNVFSKVFNKIPFVSHWGNQPDVERKMRALTCRSQF